MRQEAADDPFELFLAWFADAKRSEPRQAEAMAFATVDKSFMPNVRMVLLKSVESEGLVFFTNLESAKGEELAANHGAAVCFHWKSVGRQIRVRGVVQLITAAQANAYFAIRPRGSKLGAWASRQSRPLQDRAQLKEAFATAQARFQGRDIPRPHYWSGYRLCPIELEFWQQRRFRLHERRRFHRASPTQPWIETYLYP